MRFHVLVSSAVTAILNSLFSSPTQHCNHTKLNAFCTFLVLQPQQPQESPKSVEEASCKCQLQNFPRHNMIIFDQDMLKFKETEKALQAFVSDTETWVGCGKMRKTWSTTKSKFRHCEEIQSNKPKGSFQSREFLAFVDRDMDCSGRWQVSTSQRLKENRK